MTLLAGVFTALGISAYILLWRYIFLQFFKLVKPYEDDQDSLHEATSNFFHVLFSSCSKTSCKNQEVSSQIVTNIPTQEQSVDLTSEHFSSRVFKEVEHYEKILDAYKPLKLCLRSGIGRCGKSMVTEKDKSRIPKLRDMQAVDDDARDTQSPGNPELRDVGGGFNTLEVVKCDTTPLSRKPNVQLGREEKNLNTMIRRLVAAELMKCCEKEHGAMSRAHSDTNNRVNWKRNKYNKQAVNLDANLSSYCVESHPVSKELVCDFGNIESALTISSSHKKSSHFLGERIQSDVTPKFLIENSVDVDHSCDFHENDDANDEKGIKSITIVKEDISISSKGGGSDRMNESLENENVASIRGSETQMIATTTADRTLRPIDIAGKYEDASTQTEHMYMIRAVRSCPGRRSRIKVLGTSREKSKARTNGKVLSTEIFTLPAFLYRKASDNLIYEMGKGSRSPSYIPVPERFRWRYVTPTKVD